MKRSKTIPSITYPDLPVSARREEIKKAIAEHQVVIVAGETGSGKTTQLPKMCLELGRGTKKLIGHTQPRRIAARSVAERIAEELGQRIGEGQPIVGYKIRFDDTLSKHTAVKLMTDGVLLNEIQFDPLLRAYDTIIIDEAHERSLNIDFLLGFLKQLLPKRPDLKVIITSATIQPEAFAEHFADAEGRPAPIIEVSGRTFPVEIRYRPLVRTVENKRGELQEMEVDPLEGLVAACRELMQAGPGDILCFFSGEREIRDAAEALEGALNSGRGSQVDILPLFGRLSNAEQHRVFHPGGGRRRIVLATNIAETSLTVPGIHFVVDTGLARMSRYSHRTKVQRLPVEPISQASAKQRSGRCGRIADGIAIRLYSEEDFLARPEFTDPEILRTHLASVILSMAALGLGDIEAFPFLQMPDRRSVRDGVSLLQELQALTPENPPGLTDIGRDLARIPTDPRLARMLVAAHHFDVLEATAVIVAALSIQDVRERPLEHQQRADELHARFAGNSDFISIIALWNYIQQQRNDLSGNAFRRLCRDEFLHYVRIREWMDLVRQLLSGLQDLRWNVQHVRHVHELHFDPEVLDEDAVHKSVLSGLLTHIGMREGNGRQFVGPRQTQFVIHPSSHVAKKPPQWVMAAELVETSQLFARTVGPVREEWLEELAPHLVKCTYSEPVWSRSKGAALVREKVLLLGLPIVADRQVLLGKIDRALAREMFIRNALVEGDWRTRHAFFHSNQALLGEAASLEDKARRRDIVVDDDVLFDFYDRKIPQRVVSARHFDSWWKKARHKRPDLLDFDFAEIIGSAEGAAAADEFPDVWQQGSLEFALSYVFRPGDTDDGITMQVPLPLLNNVDGAACQWLVAGMREELVVSLIRSLPKAIRKSVVPATEFAKRALERMRPFDGAIDVALADALRSLGGHGIDAADFDWSRVPDHLRMRFAVVDRRGEVLRSGRDLVRLQQELSNQVTQAVATATARSQAQRGGKDGVNPGRLHSGRTKGSGNQQVGGSAAGVVRGGASVGGVLARAERWDSVAIGDVPESIESVIDGLPVESFPALVQVGESEVVLQAFPSVAAAAAQQFRFVLDALVREVRVSDQQMLKGLPLRQRVALESGVAGGFPALLRDVVTVVAKDVLLEAGPVIRSPERFEDVVVGVRQSGPGLVRQYVVALAPVALAVADMRAELRGWSGEVIDEMRGQLDFYFGEHAVARHGVAPLKHVPRYVAAMQARLELMDRDPVRDEELDDVVREALRAFDATVQRLPAARSASPQLKDVRWLIEELRVSLFAQHLGTARSVSLQRVLKALAKVQ